MLLEALLRAIDDDAPLWDRPAVEVAAVLSSALQAPEPDDPDSEDDTCEQGVRTLAALLGRVQGEDEMYGDHATCAWGRTVLDALGEPARVRLAELLDARSPTLRLEAVECFARYGAWEREDGEGTRGRRAQETSAYHRALPKLLALVSDPEAPVRASALSAVQRGLQGSLDRPSLDALLARQDDPSPEVRAVLPGVLQRLKAPEARLAARALLDDAVAGVRSAALSFFDENTVAADVPRLLARLDDEDPRNAESAVRILGALGAPEARDGIARALQRTPSASQRLTAAFALASVADASVVPVLREVVRLQEPPALMAALILGGLRATEATDEVVALIENGPLEVGNFDVFQALEMMRDPRSAGPVRRFVQDSIDRHGWRARDVVNRTGVTPPEKQRRDALSVLGILRDAEARPLLRTTLAKGDIYAQRVASLALGLAGQAEDARVLEALFDTKDHPHTLPFNARLAATLLDPNRLPHLLEATDAASEGLSKHGRESLLLATALSALAEQRCAPAADFVLRLVGAWLSAPKTEQMSFGVPYERATRAMHRELRDRWSKLR